MKKLLFLSLIYLYFSSPYVVADVISGKIDRYDTNYQNKIVDSKTQKGLSNAKITIPEIHYTTYSNKDGTFKLNADVNDKTVLFVEKEGYKVFSLTVDNSVLKNPLKLGIEQTSPFDMQITDGVIHLGDNLFSDNSANSGDFRLNAKGHYLSQTFKRPSAGANQDVVIKIGTIIGLDTKKAKQLGQNRIAKVYSSPAEVIVNGHKVAILEVNGDNHTIVINKNILKDTNELIIRTGRNLFQTEYVDYDDMELANIRIEVQEKTYYARH